MVLTEEEKRERNRLAVKKYREKIKKQAKAGTPEATKQVERTKYNTLFSHARNFISKQAKRKDLPLLRELIAERQKALNKEAKKENKKS